MATCPAGTGKSAAKRSPPWWISAKSGWGTAFCSKLTVTAPMPRLSLAVTTTVAGQVSRGWSPRGWCETTGSVKSGPTWKAKTPAGASRGRVVTMPNSSPADR